MQNKKKQMHKTEPISRKGSSNATNNKVLRDKSK